MVKRIDDRTKLSVLSSGPPKEMERFSAPAYNGLDWNMWTSARAAVGWENPRTDYEAPALRMTLASRQRQLHDEDKSCGIQPAYIRVIYRRLLLLLCSKSTFREG